MNFNFKDHIELEDDRVYLRPMQTGDKELLLAVATSTPSLVQYSPFYIHTENFLEEYIETALRDREAQFRYPFVIYDKKKKFFS